MNECKECRYYKKGRGQVTCNLGNDQTIGRRCADWDPAFVYAERKSFVKGEDEE